MTICGGQRDALTTARLKENTDATRARPQQRLLIGQPDRRMVPAAISAAGTQITLNSAAGLRHQKQPERMQQFLKAFIRAARTGVVAT
jgi:hypothetical protein